MLNVHKIREKSMNKFWPAKVTPGQVLGHKNELDSTKLKYSDLTYRLPNPKELWPKLCISGGEISIVSVASRKRSGRNSSASG